MATGRPRFYWDSAPIIAWIKDEKRDDPSEMDGLAEVIDLVERNKAVLMTSVLWRAEVLAGSLNDDQKRNLTRVFQNRYIQELSIDARVMDLAGEIRTYHKNNQQRKETLQNIRVPDAIHLASALHYEATEFHTFDGKKADGQKSGLLTLDGDVGGRRLRICVPKASQLRLNFGHNAESQDISADDAGEE